MHKNLNLTGYVDESGNIVIPKEASSIYGLKPGAKIYIEGRDNYLKLNQPVSHLSKVYIEPTNRCNLDCKTCIRNVWDEPLGSMSGDVFSKIMDGLKEFSSVPDVFFGGLGEPLTHPDIVEMVTAAKSRGSYVELITNGTLLTPEMSRQLIYGGLDMIWVSLDGATPESYADVRLGATLPKVLENLKEFHKIRLKKNIKGSCATPGGYEIYKTPYIGIAFVAMKRNIKDLPALLVLANRFAVSRIRVSNVLPYTKEMCDEILYSKAIASASTFLQLELPRMDADENTNEILYKAAQTEYGISINGSNPLEGSNRCPFISRGSIAISWNGNVSPCIPLLHTYMSYVNKREHYRKQHSIGNISERELKELWELPEYISFRERVESFDFSPCTTCGGCDLAENNDADCIGNEFPTCGNCPWAQGLVQCP
jgi:MoaA/NifB/PqqE/SkfB family radical SAM enzyme